MIDWVLDSTVKHVAHAALTGLAARQRVLADNVANVQTPGFLAGRVQFEQALRDAVENRTSPTDAAPTVSRSLEPTRPDGNNVNLDHEVLTNVDTGLRYQLMLHVVEGKTAGLAKTIQSLS